MVGFVKKSKITLLRNNSNKFIEIILMLLIKPKIN
jgi:hypothetical protein